MAVPKRKTSKSRRNMRRAHNALVAANVVENSTTGERQLSHKMTKDGYYNGRQVIIPKAKKESDQEDHDENHNH